MSSPGDTAAGPGGGGGGGAVARLRRDTAPAHDAVDAAYGRFDLTDRGDYAAFLQAHARALPAVERALAHAAALPLPAWRPRTADLAADLADLGMVPPDPLPFAKPDDAAAAWGMLYVIEGSRLGGTMLERRVGADLPRRYLAARHRSGEWRALLHALDAAAGDEAWHARAGAAAAATFALYGAAVDGFAVSPAP